MDKYDFAYWLMTSRAATTVHESDPPVILLFQLGLKCDDKTKASKIAVLTRAKQLIRILTYDSILYKKELDTLRSRKRGLAKRLGDLCEVVTDKKLVKTARKHLQMFGI